MFTPQPLVQELLATAQAFILAEPHHRRLGIALTDVLDMASEFCCEGEWQMALDVCERGEAGLKRFTIGYVGANMDTSYGSGAVQYYFAIARIGEKQTAQALKHFEASWKAFQNGTASQLAMAAVWLAVAKVHISIGEFNEATWALNLGRNVIEMRPGQPAAELRKRIEAEFQVARAGHRNEVRTNPKKQAVREERKPEPKPAEAKPGSKSAARTNVPRQDGHALLLMPLFGSLAAGKSLWMGEDSVPDDMVEVDRLRIKGKPYRIINLKDQGRTVRVESSKMYGIAQVVGNSMNRLTHKLNEPRYIENGDYVLLAASREGEYAAQEGDVVAAALDDITGRRGVVKRYRLVRGERMLLSESDDPNEGDLSLDNLNGEIFAEVIAVLKPETEENGFTQ